MSRLTERVKWFYHFLGSKELALSLLLLLCFVLLQKAFIQTEDIHLGVLARILFGFMGLNLILCTVRRMRSLSKPVLVVHLGTILTLAGSVISSFGFIATVNIYEGSMTDTAYRWDKKNDLPLGVNLTVRKMHTESYPVPVKVGVLKGEEKVALFELKTGESFHLEPYTVKVDSLEILSESLRLSVFDGGRLIGSADTEGEKNLPTDFPYDFQLVAFKTPRLKRAWADLALSKDSHVLAEGTSEVNKPLTWEKLTFYYTKMERDRYGLPYAGIQITNDPGKPYVYSGFAVIGIGSVMYLLRKRIKAAKR